MQYLSHNLKLNFKFCEVSLTFKMMEILIEHFPISVNLFLGDYQLFGVKKFKNRFFRYI